MSFKNRLLLLSIIIGNTIEWLEFTLFAYLSIKITPYFFPHDAASLGLLKTYMIFGTSYFVRPLGSIFFGYIGDRIGRVSVLKHSLIIMSIATASIALIPSYREIGYLSPLLLVLLRIFQGLSLAGEFNSSQLLLIEIFGKDKPYSFGVLGPLSASLGMVMGSILSSLVYSGYLADDSWRIAFLSSAFLGLLAYFIRKFLKEPSGFLNLKEKGLLEKHPPLAALKKNKYAFFLCFFSSMFISNFVYLGSFFYERIAFTSSSIGNAQIHKIIIWGQILASLIMTSAFFFLHKVNPRRYTLIALGLSTLLAPIMISCAMTDKIYFIFFGQCLYGILNGLVSSSLLTFINLQFPLQTRMSGTSLSWSLGASLFGGTSLLIGELLHRNGNTILIGFYISLSAFLPLLLIIRKKKIN